MINQPPANPVRFNVSLLESTGLNGINLSDAEIGGDLAFFEKMQRKEQWNPNTNADANSQPAKSTSTSAGGAKYTANNDNNHSSDTGEAPQEAAIEVTKKANELRGRLQLAGAKIGGDCKLLFHRSFGPHIKAERIEVGGALAIGPKCDHAGVGDRSYQKLIQDGRDEIAKIRYVASFGAEQWNQFRFGKPPFTFKSLNQNGSQDNDKSYQIDLGNARSTYLHHPWQAWPATGHLIIAGFRYERALEFGPLAPNPFPDGSDEAFKTEIASGSRITLGLLAISALLLLYWIALFFIQIDALRQSEVSVLLVFFSASAIYRLVRANTSPNKFQVRPMALEWLKLQLVERNAYRSNLTLFRWGYNFWRELSGKAEDKFITLPKESDIARRSRQCTGHIYHSLEPYKVAVNALRESGRWISANLVEEARLTVRDEQLSWRNHLIQKSLFRLIQLLNNYGFNLSRPLFWVGFLVCCSTVLTYQAAVNGAITQKVMQVDTDSRPPTPLMSTQKTSCTYACYPVPDGLNALVFSIDQVVPLVDLGQNSNWEVSKTIAPRWAPRCMKWLTFEILFFFIRIIGFAMVGLLILAFSTRISLVHQRYSD